MSAVPWFKCYQSDWLSGAAALKAVERGIYFTLIAMMYDRREPLREDRLLARQCGATQRQFDDALALLVETGKILRTEAGLWNKRVGEEISNCFSKSEKSRQAAHKRHSEKTEQKQRNEDADASVPHVVRNASQKSDAEVRSQKSEVGQGSTAPAPVDVSGLDWGALEKRCRAAAGWQNHPSTALFKMTAIIGLIQAGCDLEIDILPTITRIAHRARSPSWNYFITAIQQARDDRLGAMTAPNPTTTNGNSYATRSRPNSIADSFAAFDASLQQQWRELEAEERRLAESGNGEIQCDEGVVVIS